MINIFLSNGNYNHQWIIYITIVRTNSMPGAVIKGWERLGEGSYNHAYLNRDKQLVVKVQKNIEDKTDTPERSVRLWNKINHNLFPKAKILRTNTMVGWVCPYIEGTQATDEEMAGALISIYNRTGRIVVDAPSPNNFIKTSKNKIVCIDIGMALQMEQREDIYFSNTSSRKSIVSLEAWSELKESYLPFLEQKKNKYPKTVDTIQALLFIKAVHPDCVNASFLEKRLGTVEILAKAYQKLDDASSEVVKAGKNLVHLQNTQEICKVELLSYINSRGSISEDTQKFSPSLTTLFFRNLSLTTYKINAIKDLIEAIQRSGSLEEIQSLMTDSMNNPKLISAYYFTSGLAAALNNCNRIIESALCSLNGKQEAHFYSKIGF